MTNNIKRNNWSRFCRKFSTTNQFNNAEVQQMGSMSEQENRSQQFSFVGMALKKEGRLIDGVQLFGATSDAKSTTIPVVTITNPKEISVERDKNGTDRKLIIKSGDGKKVTIIMHNGVESDNRQKLIEKTAYSIFESRGHSHGDDQNDWQQAERLIEEVVSTFE